MKPIRDRGRVHAVLRTFSISVWLILGSTPAFAASFQESLNANIGWYVLGAIVFAALAYALGRTIGRARTVRAPLTKTPVTPIIRHASPPTTQLASGTPGTTAWSNIQKAKQPSKLSNFYSPAAFEWWWVRIPAVLRRYSATLSTAWLDGIYLTPWPRAAMLLSISSAVVGLITGASHWSPLTIDATGAPSPPAIVFAQMLPLLMIAVAVGSISANAGTMLVLGYAIGDFVFAGPQLPLWGNPALPSFFYLRLPQLISYIFFFMLAAVPILTTKRLLAGLSRWTRNHHVSSEIVCTGAAALVQAGLVYGWTLGAIMVIRIFWAWAGQYPPLSERHYLQATDPWLPIIAAAAMLLRGWLTFRARSDKRLEGLPQKLLAGLRDAEQRRASSRRFPQWAGAVLTALVMTLLMSGYINSLFLGALVLLLFFGILLARRYVLPKLGIWVRWATLMIKAPLVLRLAAALFAGYWLTRFVLILPGQATALNGIPGQFGAEIASAFLGMLLIIVLVPEQTFKSTRKELAEEAASKTRSAQTVGTGVQLMLVAAFVLLSSSKLYADICLDPVCCFGTDDWVALAIVGLLLLLAILLFWEMFAAIAAEEAAVLALGESAELIEGGALTAVDLDETTYVIGKLAATADWEGLEGFQVLNDPAWSHLLNRWWIQKGIEDGATFLLTSPLTPETLLSTEIPTIFGPASGLSVYGEEIQWLTQAGYTLVTDLAGNLVMVPPI